MDKDEVLEHLAFAQQQLEKVKKKPDAPERLAACRIYEQIIERLTMKLSALSG